MYSFTCYLCAYKQRGTCMFLVIFDSRDDNYWLDFANQLDSDADRCLSLASVLCFMLNLLH